jgi:hypothetical protein
MWCWLNANAGGVQAVAALGTFLLTVVLAGVSYWYARLTERSLAIARQQFDRQWRPQLGISLEYVAPLVARLALHNISNCSVVITGVLLKATDDNQPGVSYAANQPLDAHGKETLDVARYLVDVIRLQSREENSQRRVWLGVNYEALGTIGGIAYLQYSVRVSQGQVVEIFPIDVVPKPIAFSAV